MTKRHEVRLAGASLPVREVAGAAALAGAAAVGGKVAWDRVSSGNGTPGQEFRLRAEEALPDGVRRVAHGQLARAQAGLERAPRRKLSEGVHDTRKRLKRLRAVVRLARGALGQEVYKRENSAFRDTGRRLAGVRDAAVLIETLDGLEKAAGVKLPAGVTGTLRARLEEERERALVRLKEDQALVGAVVSEIEAADTRVDCWTLRTGGFGAVEPGLRRTYRRGRKAMRRAQAEPSEENFHEWRKRVKDLWHSLQLLRLASPSRMSKLAKRAHRLSDLLGDDHDLAELRRYALSHRECFEDPGALALVGVIDGRRMELQQHAIELGARVYAKRPKRFVKRIERGWVKHAQVVAG
jgi:CHAD domain-containing protein